MVAINEPERFMRYPVTPILSVDAVHDRLICEAETPVALKALGALGAVLSEVVVATVVALAAVDWLDALPAASIAWTV